MKFRNGIWVAVLLAGCHGGDRLDETYSYGGTDRGAFGRQGSVEIRFKPDGTAVVKEGRERSEVKYEVDGNDIKLITPAGTKIFTRKSGDVLESGRIRLARGSLEEAVKKNPSAPMATAPPPALPPHSTADKSLPLEKYVLLDGSDKNRDFAYLYYALGGKPDSPDEDLKVLSSEYYNERDGFKKKEIAERERPRIEQEKERHRASMRYFALKLPSFGILNLQPYDFEKKGFVLPGTTCSQSSIRMASGVVLALRPLLEPHCFLRVADDDQAKKLEALRVSADAYVEVTFYGYVEGVSSGALDVTPVAMDLHVREGREVPGRGPGASVAEFRLRF